MLFLLPNLEGRAGILTRQGGTVVAPGSWEREVALFSSLLIGTPVGHTALCHIHIDVHCGTREGHTEYVLP